jgi:DNA-binding transcriptional LysR family regulator
MTDLNSLMIFAKVVEANSFSEAARRLRMPISTVSRRIADLEDQLGVRLLDRSTRNLRLTDVGSDILEHAQRSAEISESVDSIASNQLSDVSGLLRLSAPPSISDSLLAPMIGAFQASYPNVRIQVFVTDRFVDHIAEGMDLVFRFGALKDSAMIARKILIYRHLLLASPEYLKQHDAPKKLEDLHAHRLIAFSHGKPENSWQFVNRKGEDKHSFAFQPYLSMNDFSGIAPALLAGAGIGELPPLVQPELIRSGKLVEVMPEWRFQTFSLSVVYLGNRHIPRAVRVFKEFAAQMAPSLFPDLPH